MASKFQPKAPLGSCTEMHVAMESPLGTIQISGCSAGVHQVKLQADATPGKAGGEALFECTVKGGPEDLPEPLKQCTSWLVAYFSEPRKIRELPMPSIHHPVFQKDSFTRAVLLVLASQVKFGDSVSYKQLASLAGNEKAARAVGGAMRSNPMPLLIPCHRVICSDGEIGDYMGGKGNHLKQWLLSREKHLQGEV